MRIRLITLKVNYQQYIINKDPLHYIWSQLINNPNEDFSLKKNLYIKNCLPNLISSAHNTVSAQFLRNRSVIKLVEIQLPSLHTMLRSSTPIKDLGAGPRTTDILCADRRGSFLHPWMYRLPPALQLLHPFLVSCRGLHPSISS